MNNWLFLTIANYYPLGNTACSDLTRAWIERKICSLYGNKYRKQNNTMRSNNYIFINI